MQFSHPFYRKLKQSLFIYWEVKIMSADDMDLTGAWAFAV